MRCEWCDSEKVILSSDTVYWELPDGTRAIEIKETPTYICGDCQINYQSDSIVKEIEDQLFLIDTKKLSPKITYEDLMKIPRLLKRNYFDF
jgi:uncharacterized YokU family protein